MTPFAGGGGALTKRMYDLVIRPGTLTAGSVLTLNVQTPVDGPFVLKARAARCQYQPAISATPGQTLIQNLAWRFAGPDQQYYAQDLIPWSLEAPSNYGQSPNGLWLQNSIVYRPGSTIESQIQNIGAADIPGLELYFRGYQLFDCSQVPGLTYPKGRIATNPYTVITGPGTPTIPGNWSTALTPLLQVTDNQLLLKMQPPSDADFVLRAAGAVSPSNLAFPGGGQPYPMEVTVTLRDWTQKAYSNLPVHVDILFGQFPAFLNLAVGPAGSPGYQSGLFVPEIYIPKNQFLYYDIARSDAYLLNTFGLAPAAEDFVIGWKGAKVYQA